MDIGQLAGQYAFCFKKLKAECYLEPRGEASSEGLTAAKEAREALVDITFEAIAELADRRALWINLYNGAVIDRAIAMGVQRSVKEVSGFFRRRWLQLAGERLSLNDIEHGFLRNNRRHPIGLLPPLWARSHLTQWIAQPFDARIHFALNCGARSCPPIGIYSNDRIEEQLDLATVSFLETEVEITPQCGTINANQILRWYRGDFTGMGGLEEMLRRYRSDELEKRTWRFIWQPYDWSI